MKHWLQSRTLREQLLVTLLVVVFAFIWVLSAVDRVSARVADWQAGRKQLAAQALWIEQREQIEAKAGEAVKNLDPARTQDAAKLVATLTTLASQVGLQPSIEPPHVDRTPQFNYSTVRMNFRGATLPAMLGLYDELTKLAPYLNLESMVIQADRAKVGQLNVTLQISATQIAP